MPVPPVLLALDLSELDRPKFVAKCPEGPARFDLGELVVITDEQELRLGGLGVLGEASDGARAGYAGLVDDQD